MTEAIAALEISNTILYIPVPFTAHEAAEPIFSMVLLMEQTAKKETRTTDTGIFAPTTYGNKPKLAL